MCHSFSLPLCISVLQISPIIEYKCDGRSWKWSKNNDRSHYQLMKCPWAGKLFAEKVHKRRAGILYLIHLLYITQARHIRAMEPFNSFNIVATIPLIERLLIEGEALIYVHNQECTITLQAHEPGQLTLQDSDNRNFSGHATGQCLQPVVALQIPIKINGDSHIYSL